MKRIEELREVMHKAIAKYGHTSNEVLIASQNLDIALNQYGSFHKNN